MFFSVIKPIKILGKVYIPCVCYEVTKVLELTVNKLASDGTARLYDKEVGFMNGKVLERAKKVSKKVSKKEAVKETDETVGF